MPILSSIIALYSVLVAGNSDQTFSATSSYASPVDKSNLCRLLEWVNKSGESLSDQNKETLSKLKAFYLSDIEKCMSQSERTEPTNSSVCQNPLENPKAGMSKECKDSNYSQGAYQIIVQTSSDSDDTPVEPNPKKIGDKRCITLDSNNTSSEVNIKLERQTSPQAGQEAIQNIHPNNAQLNSIQLNNTQQSNRNNNPDSSKKFDRIVHEITTRSFIPPPQPIISTVVRHVFITKNLPPVIKTVIRAPIIKTVTIPPQTKIITRPPIIKRVPIIRTIIKPMIRVVTKKVPIFIKQPPTPPPVRPIVPNNFFRPPIPVNNNNRLINPYYTHPQNNRRIAPAFPINPLIIPLNTIPRPEHLSNQQSSFTDCNGQNMYNPYMCKAFSNTRDNHRNTNYQLDVEEPSGSAFGASKKITKAKPNNNCNDPEDPSVCSQASAKHLNRGEESGDINDNLDVSFKKASKPDSKNTNQDDDKIVEVIERVVVKTVTKTVKEGSGKGKSVTSTSSTAKPKSKPKSAFETSKSEKLESAKKNKTEDIIKKVINDKLNKKSDSTTTTVLDSNKATKLLPEDDKIQPES